MKAYLKVIIPIIAIVAVAVAAYLFFSKGSGLNAPESVAYDALGKRFLISNVQGQSIVAMSPEGKYSTFCKSGLKAPRGIIIKDTNLYVADATNIQVIDTKTAKITATIPIQGALMLNDLAMDKAGLLYATDTKGDCVFVVNPATKKAEKVVSPLLKAPNGIVYDMPRNQMFIVGFAERTPILSLSTLDRSIRIFMDTIYSDMDGIAIDDLGRIYITSWKQDMIFEIPQEQNRFILAFKDIKDAADILYYKPNNELIVPLNTGNKILRIPLD
jgi:YVTN family beta-propeller protein